MKAQFPNDCSSALSVVDAAGVPPDAAEFAEKKFDEEGEGVEEAAQSQQLGTQCRVTC